VSTLRKALYVLLLLAFVLIAAVFAYSNPEPISVDIGLVRFDGVSMALAFACAFAFGWVFGLISAGVALLRLVGDRRRLRRDLKYAESELSQLRSLPMHDAH
jgi:putative membrane protein